MDQAPMSGCEALLSCVSSTIRLAWVMAVRVAVQAVQAAQAVQAVQVVQVVQAVPAVLEALEVRAVLLKPGGRTDLPIHRHQRPKNILEFSNSLGVRL
jgi:hypothetical protein